MKKQVFELNEDGTLKDIFLMSDEEIENTDKIIVTESWQDGLFEPKWDFEQEKWVEGLSNEEVEQRLKEIELKQNKPSESDMLTLAILELAVELEKLKGDK